MYICIFTRAYLLGKRTRYSSSYAHLHRLSSLYAYVVSTRFARVPGWLPKDGTKGDRGETREEGNEGGASRRRKRCNKKINKKKKETTSTSFLSRLSGRTVCILSRAAPREFNSIFNLPKPLYANSATDVEYSLSSLSLSFGLFLSCVPFVPAHLSLIRSSTVAQLPTYSSSLSERRHTFPPLLASPLRMLHR